MENNNDTQKEITGACNPTLKNNKLYSKKYYIIFFTIMIVTFILFFWLCNYTKLKETFQLIALTALAIAIAEYTARKILKQ